jgi:hypothetical protein
VPHDAPTTFMVQDPAIRLVLVTPAAAKTTTICAAAVRNLLDLSTAHLPQHLGSHGLFGHDSVTAYEQPDGWLT